MRWWLLTLTALAARAEAAPVLSGSAGDARCAEALDLGRAAFNATGDTLLWPIAKPANPDIRIAIAQNGLDISAGHGVDADPALFDTVSREPTKIVFVQRRATGGGRMILVETGYGWRGDFYEVLLAEPAETAEQAITRLRQSPGTSAIDAGLTPPLIFHSRRANAMWLIDRGQRFEPLHEWTVMVPTGGKLARLCQIRFGTSDGLALLPRPVRRLAALLDEALGPGADEGTLQQTARRRIMVAQGWANAASRPWAVTGNPYAQSVATIDQGLASWSRHNIKRTQVVTSIHALRRPAERALGDYLARRFSGRAGAPRSDAHAIIERMSRSYFAFPGGG
ncbi:MAG: hypothetical protein ABIT69_10105 [Sphingomicrobium sp.]